MKIRKTVTRKVIAANRMTAEVVIPPMKRENSIQFFAVQCGCRPGTETTVQTERCLTAAAICQHHLGLPEFASRIADENFASKR